ncbi:uncharacterized protein LOC143174342 [Nomia melanderi]|uniref:uncharacterized protein LOC143174342 n=1 Tax=Nomia melanderi TaxID=2448451 RepID=UPI003FCE5E12
MINYYTTLDSLSKCLNVKQDRNNACVHCPATLPKVQSRCDSALVNFEKEDATNSNKNTNLPNIRCEETIIDQRLTKRHTERRKRNPVSEIDREVEKVKSDWQLLKSYHGESGSKKFISSSKTKKLYDTLEEMTQEIERIQKSYLDPKSNQYLHRSATKMLEASESSFQERADNIKDALFSKANTCSKSITRKTIDERSTSTYANLNLNKCSEGRSLLANKQCWKDKNVIKPNSNQNFKKGNLHDASLKSQMAFEIENYLENYINNVENNFKNEEPKCKDLYSLPDRVTEIVDNNYDEDLLVESIKKINNNRDEACVQNTMCEELRNMKDVEFNTHKLRPQRNNNIIYSDSSIQTQAALKNNTFMEMSLQALNIGLPQNSLSRVLQSEYLKKDASLKPM